MGEKTAEKIRQSIERGSTLRSIGVRLNQAGDIAADIVTNLTPEISRHLSRRDELAQRPADSCGAAATSSVSSTSSACQLTSRPPSTLSQSLPIRSTRSSSVGEKNARCVLHNGAAVELTLSEPSDFEMLLFLKTGSHAPTLREVTEQAGENLTKLPEDEADIYAAAGLPSIPAVLRENTGEIEAALAGKLPRLITLSDIRGDVHAHTTATDGDFSIEEMALAAKALGYEYMAITDHSHSLAMVGGLTADRLRAQMAEIRALGDSLGIRIFAGSEVDIKADGSLDFDDDLLAELDFVIASAHLYNNQSRGSAPDARMIKAIENPHVDLIAHPTGRIILRRDPYAVDIDALSSKRRRAPPARRSKSTPRRRGSISKIRTRRRAAQAGVKIMINTDAHRIVEYDLMHYGVTTARQRAWLTRRRMSSIRCRSLTSKPG